jgi:hypothetical protein
MTRSGPIDDEWRSRQIADAMRGIARYLDEHPNASDTLSGVCSWWLAASAAPLGPQVVQIALDRLVESRAIEARAMADGTVIYVRSKSDRERRDDVGTQA